MVWATLVWTLSLASAGLCSVRPRRSAISNPLIHAEHIRALHHQIYLVSRRRGAFFLFPRAAGSEIEVAIQRVALAQGDGHICGRAFDRRGRASLDQVNCFASSRERKLFVNGAIKRQPIEEFETSRCRHSRS